MPEFKLTQQQEEDANGMGYICPITFEIMEDPVYAHDGEHAFERDAIESLLEGEQSAPCPNCRKQFTHADLTDAAELKRDISAWLQALGGQALTENDARDALIAMIPRVEELKKEAEKYESEIAFTQYKALLKLWLTQARDGAPSQGLPPCNNDFFEEYDDTINYWLNSTGLDADDRNELAAAGGINYTHLMDTPLGHMHEVEKRAKAKQNTPAPSRLNSDSLAKLQDIAKDVKKAYKHERHHTGKGFLKRFSKGRKGREDMLQALEASLQAVVASPKDDAKMKRLMDTIHDIKTQIKVEQGEHKYKLGESGMLSLVQQIESTAKNLHQKAPAQRATGVRK